jgi:hypothetical protein
MTKLKNFQDCKLTIWVIAFLHKLIVAQPVKKFCCTQSFYHIYKTTSMVPIPSEMIQFRLLFCVYVRPILILSSHLNLSLRSGVFLSGLPNNFCIFYITLMCVTCLAHLIPLDLIILIIIDEEYKLWNSLLWNFLVPPVSSTLICQHILVSMLQHISEAWKWESVPRRKQCC